MDVSSENGSKSGGDGDGRDAVTWFTLYGNRYAVAGCLLVAILAVLFALLVGGVIPVHNDNSMRFLFSAFIGGNFTLITVVLSINQLVLSQQLRAPDEIQTEIERTVEYRQQVESVTDIDVMPSIPSAFLRQLLESTRQQAQALGGLVAETDRPDLRDDVDAIVDRITGSVDRADHLIPNRDGDGGEGETRTDDSEGIFAVLAVMLDTNLAVQICHVEQIRSDHGDQLRDEERSALDDLIDALQQVDVARQYFKTIYMQEELARLSRTLLYVGIPAILWATVTVTVFRSPLEDSIPEMARGPVVALGIVVSMAPIAILFAFVLRITVVAQRTAAVTPFTTPRQEQPGESSSDRSLGGTDDSSGDAGDDEGTDGEANPERAGAEVSDE